MNVIRTYRFAVTLTIERGHRDVADTLGRPPQGPDEDTRLPYVATAYTSPAARRKADRDEHRARNTRHR